MPIPKNIKKEHVLQAMLNVWKKGTPAGRGPRNWAVLYEGKQYPCKLLISWANIYANGFELNPNPNNFQTYMAQVYLRKLGFQIIAI